MKSILKIAAMFMLVFSFSACSEESEFVPQSLDVTPNNIAGIWKLEEVAGKEIPEGTFCYIGYVRRDRKFTIYQKFDSMYPRCITGTYSIEKDPHKGYVLSGKYDFGMGDWNNSYIVKALYETTMTLVVDAENGETSKYVRCNEVPADIIDSIR